MIVADPTAARGPPGLMPAPTSKQPLPRRPTLSGKVRTRDEAEMDSDLDMMAQSPGKRARVTFDPQIQFHGDEWEKSPDLIRHEIFRAVENHRIGDSNGYDHIKEVFTTEPTADDVPSPTALTNHILAMTNSVSLLDKSCHSLVQASLRLEWLGRDDAFVSIYVRFLGNLVSAQGGSVPAVLSHLVGTFSNLPSSTGHLPGYPHVRRGQLHSRAHIALKYLLRLVPSGSSALSSILASAFPHSSESKRSHIDYIQNLLQLIDYAPELKSDILALITDRLVKIDVQVQVDIEDLEDDVGEGLVQDVSRQSNLDRTEVDDGSDESDTDSVTSEESLDEETQRVREVKANVQKMDAIMDLLFTYYAPSYAVPSSIESQNAFRTLLNHFATIILPTYRSRHTQFLLFHFAQTSPLLIDDFVGACVHLAFDQGRPAILKQSSAAYMASFIARGAHVPTQIVQDVFIVLGNHLDQVRSKEEASCPGPDLRRYGSFYAMVQSLLYIFCFRWRDLLASPEDYVEEEDAAMFDSNELTWAPGIKDILTRTIYSKFNPLRVCSPPIVNEFARIALHLRFMYVFPLIETNKRVRLQSSAQTSGRSTPYSEPERQTALSVRKDEAHHQLDAYFPFDPYHLPTSKRWIDGDYVEWRGIPGLDKTSGDPGSESEEEADGDSEEGEELTETDGDSD